MCRKRGNCGVVVVGEQSSVGHLGGLYVLLALLSLLKVSQLCALVFTSLKLRALFAGHPVPRRREERSEIM